MPQIPTFIIPFRVASRQILSLPRQSHLALQLYSTQSPGSSPKKSIQPPVPFFTTSIQPTRLEAIKEVEERKKNSICVFADGSADSEGHIGAAAVHVVDNGKRCAFRVHLGRMAGNSSNIAYYPELYSAVVALRLIANLYPPDRPAARPTIFMDCQQAIKALSSTETEVHAYIRLWRRSLRRYYKLRPDGEPIHLAWAPSLSGMEAKYADAQAKLAAGGANGLVASEAF